jgi:hypothetical protein
VRGRGEPILTIGEKAWPLYTRLPASPSRGDQQQVTIRNLKDARNSKNACHSLDASNRSDTSNNSIASATSNSKDDSNIMTAHNSRNASNSRSESNNRTANTVWTPSKAGMLAKTVKQQHGGRPTAAETIGTSQCQQQKGDPQQQGCQK